MSRVEAEHRHAPGARARALLERIMAAGVSPPGATDAPQRADETTAIRMVNISAVILAAISLCGAAAGALDAKSLSLMACNLAFCGGYLTALLSNAKRHHALARWVTVIVSGADLFVTNVAFGPRSGFEFYLAPVVMMPMVMFPRGKRPIALAYSFFSVVVALVALAQATAAPWVDVAPDASRRAYYVAVGFVSLLVGGAGISYHVTVVRLREELAIVRARAEALLKSELSHQVAERSRELGDALARVGTQPNPLPRPGERFHARYRVVRALGEGGMGAVFEVERITDGQQLALKVVTGQISGAMASRFAREAEIGARIHHPNLISIVDVGIADGAPFLVMELVQLGALEGFRSRFGDTMWAVPILRQIALGLSALHAAGVVHRDLKPGNVLLEGSHDGPLVAKISDFGISGFGQVDEAADLDPEGPTVGAATPKKPDLTGTGMLLGTPLYMAPEAATGGRGADAAADVFAFGIVAYEMLTGRTPFDTPAILVAMAGQALPSPRLLHVAGLSAAAREAILGCLAENPTHRPSARSVVEVLSAM